MTTTYKHKKKSIFLYSVLALITVAYVVMSVLLFLNLLTPNLLTLLAALSLIAPVMMLSCILFDQIFTCRRNYMAYIWLSGILLFSAGYLSIPVLFMGAAHVATFLSTAIIFVGSVGCVLGDIVNILNSAFVHISGVGLIISLVSLGMSIYWIIAGEWSFLFIWGILHFVLLLKNSDILPTFIPVSESRERLPRVDEQSTWTDRLSDILNNGRDNDRDNDSDNGSDNDRDNDSDNGSDNDSDNDRDNDSDNGSDNGTNTM